MEKAKKFMSSVSISLHSLRSDITPRIKYLIFGILSGIFGYFIYYKEEVDTLNFDLIRSNIEVMDQAINGGIGGIFVVSLIGIFVFRSRGKYNINRGVSFIVGGVSITLLMTLLDLII
jgi:hypothetical protein